jgi:hypothetical protein
MNSNFRSLKELHEAFQATAHKNQMNMASATTALRSLPDLQNHSHGSFQKMHAAKTPKKTVLSSRADLQKDCRPSLQKAQETATSGKSALSSLTALQRGFQQKQTKELSAKATPFFPSQDLQNREGDVSLAHELPCVLAHTKPRSATTDTMPGSVMTDVMLAILRQKLEDEKTPKTYPIYSRNVLLNAFRVLSDADCLVKESPGMPRVHCMPHKSQSQSRRKPRHHRDVSSKEDAEDPSPWTAGNIINLPPSGDFANCDMKLERASGDSTPTAEGDTASETFSDL